MPIYAYRCHACGHQQDVLQKLSDPVLTPALRAPKNHSANKLQPLAFSSKDRAGTQPILPMHLALPSVKPKPMTHRHPLVPLAALPASKPVHHVETVHNEI